MHSVVAQSHTSLNTRVFGLSKANSCALVQATSNDCCVLQLSVTLVVADFFVPLRTLFINRMTDDAVQISSVSMFHHGVMIDSVSAAVKIKFDWLC